MLRRRNTCSMLFVFFLLLKTFYILLYLYRRQKLLTITNFTDTENCTIADFFFNGWNKSKYKWIYTNICLFQYKGIYFEQNLQLVSLKYYKLKASC